MSRVSVFLLALIPVLALAGARPPPKPVDLTLSWSVSLDASGAITSLQPTEQTNRGLYQRIEPAVRKWHFTPGKVKGKPVAAQTTLTIHITLEPVDSYYRVRVRDAGTGARYATKTPPAADGASAPKVGAVMLAVHYDAAGNVTSAKPIEGGVPKPDGDIEKAAVAAVKHWTFTPETIAGKGVAGTAHVPLCFSAQQGRDSPCKWQVGKAEVALDTNSPLTMNSIVHVETDVTAQEL